MPDKLRPFFNALIFCVTVVAMFGFIMFVADEVKTPEGGAETAETGNDVTCEDEPAFHCRASGRIEESWMKLADKEAEIKASNGDWKPGFADTLALNNAEVDYLALFNARNGDYRLIALGGDTPDLGVFCTQPVPVFQFDLNYELQDFTDSRVEALKALERFAATYNSVIALQPGYPDADLCTPVFHYNDYTAIGDTPAPGSFDKRTFFMAPQSLLPAIREERTKKQPE